MESTAENENNFKSEVDVSKVGPTFYSCDRCTRRFTKAALEIHKRVCTEKENCACSACVKYLGNKKTITEIANGVNLVKNENATDENLVKKENVSNIPSFQRTEKKCKPSNNSKSIIFKSVHLQHNEKNCTRKIFCAACELHVSWQYFGVHALQHSIKSNDNKIICSQCSNAYQSPIVFLLHFYQHTLSAHQNECAQCHCESPNCFNLASLPSEEHSYAERTEKYCFICMKLFGDQKQMITHMRVHSQEEPFSCSECQGTFRLKNLLQRHLARHCGKRPHECTSCGKRFADLATLRNHIRIHTRETPYVCDVCNRGFTQVGNLKRHMTLHIKVKNDVSEEFSREKSGAIVVQKEERASDSVISLDSNNLSKYDLPNLNKRKISYEDLPSKKIKKDLQLHKCDICGKVYAWQHDLRIHYRTHTGEKPFKCELCDKQFSQSGAIRVHLKRHHPSSETSINPNLNLGNESKEPIFL
ncbi:hypothetical protein CDAR_3161 [Caerostris darwini]|uniref:C2H2-type domain-containing protein n=1 Tax=Caerostris darwini TaxID=1538125 RepID=A0AAV4UUV5_9ARAC|nr:hypothetical protein CDAR_3161 [Caerostris darwini]